MTRIKQQAVQAASNQNEAERLIENIGANQSKVSEIENKMNDEIREIKTKYTQEAQEFNQAIQNDFEAVRIWAEANRKNLTTKTSKTAKLASGSISWRMRTPKVSVRGADKVIEALKQLNLPQFIRTKEEINKDAVLADVPTATNVSGISVSQGEDFVIKPFKTEIEKVGGVK